MKKILFRKAKKADAAGINTLGRTVVRNHPLYPPSTRELEYKNYFSVKFLETHISDPQYVYVVAEEDKKIVGVAYGVIEGGVLWNSWVVFDQNYQGKGHFKNIIKELENAYLKQGGWKIWAAILMTNKASQKAFLKNGYAKIGILKKHWGKLDFLLVDKVL